MAPTTMRSGCRKSMIAVPSAEELRVRHDIEVFRRDAVAQQHAANPLIGIDRHRALFDNHLIAADRAGDGGDDGFDIRQVGGARVALWCAHGDEDGVAAFDGADEIGGEGYAAIEVLGEQLGRWCS